MGVEFIGWLIVDSIAFHGTEESRHAVVVILSPAIEGMAMAPGALETHTEENLTDCFRGDFGVSNSFNLIHGSDSPEAAARELELFFAPGEVLTVTRAIEAWVYDSSSGKPE